MKSYVIKKKNYRTHYVIAYLKFLLYPSKFPKPPNIQELKAETRLDYGCLSSWYRFLVVYTSNHNRQEKSIL